MLRSNQRCAIALGLGLALGACAGGSTDDADALCAEDTECHEELAALAPAPPLFVNVHVIGSRFGTVTSSSSDPFASCTQDGCTIPLNGSVTLSARATHPDWFFKQWSGCSNSTEPTITLSGVLSEQTCTAVFQGTTITGDPGWSGAKFSLLRAPNISLVVLAAGGSEERQYTVAQSGDTFCDVGRNACILAPGSSVRIQPGLAAGERLTWADCDFYTGSSTPEVTLSYEMASARSPRTLVCRAMIEAGW